MPKLLREGSREKRAAILTAAQTLFERDGYEHTSMDAIALAAQVSKRTVYDYFGDKAQLRREVLTIALDDLFAALQSALDRHLAEDSKIASADELEKVLIGFAIEISTTVISSASYAAVYLLTSSLRGKVPLLNGRSFVEEPEKVLAERLAHYADRGLLDISDPREAADHFVALTVLLAHNGQTDSTEVDEAKIRSVVTGGVHTFMRAYTAKKQE